MAFWNRKQLPRNLTPPNDRGWWPLIRESFTGAWQRNIDIQVEDVLTYGTVYACVTLIARDVRTPYSGMIPGFIAGRYTFDDCHVDLDRLCRRCNVRLVPGEAVGLEAGEHLADEVVHELDRVEVVGIFFPGHRVIRIKRRQFDPRGVDMADG